MKSKRVKYLMLTAIFALVGLLVCILDGGSSLYDLAAFTPCIGTLADSITQDCDNPRISGYEDVALIFNRADIDWTAVTVDANNSRIVTGITMVSGKKPFVVYNPKVANPPFNGSNTAFASDVDRYTKQVMFYYKGIGGDASKDVVEPLKSGQFVMILQRKDHSGDGSFQVIGYQSGLTATAQEQNEENGYWSMTMETSEPSAEISFFDTDYATTKAAFDTLLALVA